MARVEATVASRSGVDGERATASPADRLGEAATDTDAQPFHVAARALLLRLDRRKATSAAAASRRRLHYDVDHRQIGEQDGIHPTQKPLEIFERPIGYHTDTGDLIYEPFSGSGSQLIAAAKMGRRCYAMELDPDSWTWPASGGRILRERPARSRPWRTRACAMSQRGRPTKLTREVQVRLVRSARRQLSKNSGSVRRCRQSDVSPLAAPRRTRRERSISRSLGLYR